MKTLTFKLGLIQPTDDSSVFVTTAPGSSEHCLFGSFNQLKSFVLPNTQTGTSLCPSSRGKATYVLGQLVVRPGLSSGSSRANILAPVPVPKIRAGDRSGEVGFNPLPESHISENRAGLPCRSGQTIRQESDQMDLHGGGIHSSAVTTRCAMAPSTGTHSFCLIYTSRKDQILKTEWSLDQTIMDRVFHLWGKPHVDLFALERNVKLATCMSPIPEPMSWKVDSLVQSWRNPYAYVYPPTSLIRACLNKSGQRT